MPLFSSKSYLFTLTKLAGLVIRVQLGYDFDYFIQILEENCAIG